MTGCKNREQIWTHFNMYSTTIVCLRNAHLRMLANAIHCSWYLKRPTFTLWTGNDPRVLSHTQTNHNSHRDGYYLCHNYPEGLGMEASTALAQNQWHAELSLYLTQAGMMTRGKQGYHILTASGKVYVLLGDVFFGVTRWFDWGGNTFCMTWWLSGFSIAILYVTSSPQRLNAHTERWKLACLKLA